jgi:hypothetical protein
MTVQTRTRKVQLSVTVNPELKVLAEELAKENKTNPSGFISQWLEELARKRKEALMIKYYKTMAHEHKVFAEESAEVIDDIVSSWDK